MRLISVCTLFIIISLPNQSFGGLLELTRELIAQNQKIWDAKTQVEIENIHKEAFLAQFGFSIGGSAGFDDNKLESSTSVSFTSDKTTTESLNLSKATLWGGNFAFEVGQQKVEQGQSKVAIFGGSKETFMSYKTLTYTQQLGANFFGRNNFLEREKLDKAIEQSKLSSKLVRENILFEFISAYINASTALENVRLTEEAYSRSVKRKNLTQKMFQDGLVRKVDFVQASMGELSMAEANAQAKISYRDFLEKLSLYLHRPILETEIDGLGVIEQILTSGLKLGDNEETIEIRAIREKVLLLEKAVNQAQNSLLPTVDLKLQYKTNEYDVTRSNSQNGITQNAHDEKVVALTFKWPLGSTVSKQTLAENRAKMMLAQRDLEMSTKGVRIKKDYLEKKLSMTRMNYELSRQAQSLAVQVLSEYNQLYRVGRTGLDQVIRAEEDLIGVEKRMAEHFKGKNIYLAGLIFLNNGLEEAVAGRNP